MDQEIVTHKYTNPGYYTVKLVVRNLLGEPDERSVALHLDEDHGEPPQIKALDAFPQSPGSYAPATFRIKSEVKNAKVCVWDFDDDRPLEIVSDCSGGLDRLVTFEKPGGYVIKLAAVNGNHAVEKTEIVNVLERPAGMVTAVLTVTDQATQVETLSTPFSFVEQFPGQQKQDVYHFEKLAPARQGYEIKEVRLQNGKTPGPKLEDQNELAVAEPFLSGMGMKNVKLTLASDRKSVKLGGDLVRDPLLGKKDKTLPNVTVPVVIVQEKRSQAQRQPITITGSFSFPGSIMLKLPELPKDWVDARRQFRRELLDADRVALQESLLPRNRAVGVQGRRFVINAVQVGEQIRVDLNSEKATPPV